ncbi:MAG: hypothetical protein JSR36_09600 [Proteobacteria bacterium]|nr:hypothetical protein [Pseudomonadota bacterium]
MSNLLKHDAQTANDAVRQEEPGLQRGGDVPTRSAELAQRNGHLTMAKPSGAMTASCKLSVRHRVKAVASRAFTLACYRVGRAGPLTLVGGAAVLTAIAIAAVALEASRGDLAALQQQVNQAQQHSPSGSAVDTGISHVIASLPTRNDMPTILATVYAQASAAKISLDVGHYAYSPPKGGSIGRYELEFPVRADYPSIRSFINGTLSALPAAGLDKLHLERKAVGDPYVNADIRFVVFMRAQDGSS